MTSTLSLDPQTSTRDRWTALETPRSQWGRSSLTTWRARAGPPGAKSTGFGCRFGANTSAFSRTRFGAPRAPSASAQCGRSPRRTGSSTTMTPTTWTCRDTFSATPLKSPHLALSRLCLGLSFSLTLRQKSSVPNLIIFLQFSPPNNRARVYIYVCHDTELLTYNRVTQVLGKENEIICLQLTPMD